MTGLSCGATHILSLSIQNTLRFARFGGKTGKMDHDNVLAFVKSTGAGVNIEGRGDYELMAPGTLVRHDLSPFEQSRSTGTITAD
jgi:hypothetical protein